MGLKSIMSSESSETQKVIYCMNLFLWHYGKKKSLGTENSLAFSLAILSWISMKDLLKKNMKEHRGLKCVL